MTAGPESGSRPGRRAGWWRVATTPLGDLARGRVTGPAPRTARAPHGWPHDVRAAGLPEPVTDLILRVVSGTRLWRREKQDVARELIAHFQDGLESSGADGSADLVRSFGDPRLASRLIRRAKRRNRPLLWHAWRRGWQAAGVLLAACVLMYLWIGLNFWFRQPRVARNFAAELNARSLSAPEEDRAWPLYVRAIASMEPLPDPLMRYWGMLRPGDPEWPAAVEYLEKSRDTLALVREGAARPVLGLVVSDRLPADFDAAIRLRARRAGKGDWEPQPAGTDNPALVGVLLPHLAEMRGFARLVSADFHAAVEAGDIDRAGRDLRAVVRLAEQSCESPFLISDLVGLAVYSLALADVGEALRDSASRLPDPVLIEWAHLLASFLGGGELRPDLGSERMFFEDLVQRVYTDDGRGDGRITAAGVRFMAGLGYETQDDWVDQLGVAPALGPIEAASAPSRRELVVAYDRVMGALRAAYDRPLSEWGDERPERALERLHPIRYRALHWTIPQVRQVFAAGESAAQRRDGLLAAIAMELYRRRHRGWPESIEGLVPGLLPAPARDRYDGAPLRFVIRDGRPVIYSVGGDRDDDGGRMVSSPPRAGDGRASPAQLGGPMAGRGDEDGDWILWPMPAREPLERDEPAPGAG